MRLVLLAIAGFVGLVLVGLDVLALRHAEDESEVDAAPQNGTTRAAGLLGLAYGLLALPGSLAPVVALVTALRGEAGSRAILSDGWTALAAVILAFVAISAALKSSRLGRWLIDGERPREEFPRTLRFLRLWWILAVLLAVPAPLAQLSGAIVAIIAFFALASALTGGLFELALRSTPAAPTDPTPDPTTVEA